MSGPVMMKSPLTSRMVSVVIALHAFPCRVGMPTKKRRHLV